MKLEEIRAICDASSPGPWHVGHIFEGRDGATIEGPDCVDIGDIYHRPNENFIAMSRTVLPKLLKAAEMTKAYIAEVSLMRDRAQCAKLGAAMEQALDELERP